MTPDLWWYLSLKVMKGWRDSAARGRPSPLGLGRRLGGPDPLQIASDLDELDAGELAEVPPRRGVVAQVHHLVVRAARGQPPVQAVPHPGCRAELAVGHLQGREYLGIQVLALGDD